MSIGGVRRRYFIDGKPADPNDDHAFYERYVQDLFFETQARMAQFASEDMALLQLKRQKPMPGGVKITAMVGIKHEETWIDVPSRPPGPPPGGEPPPEEEEPKKNPYLWAGVHIHYENVQGEAKYAGPWDLIFGIWLPSTGDSGGEPTPNQILCTYPVIRFDPDSRWAALEGNQHPETVYPDYWINPEPSVHPASVGFQNQYYVMQVARDGTYLQSCEAFARWGWYSWDLYAQALAQFGYAPPFAIDSPHDPFLAQEDEFVWTGAEPAWGLGTTEQYPLPYPYWAATIVHDPKTWLAPTDGRSEVGIQQMLAEKGITVEPLGGSYILKVGCAAGCTGMRFTLEVRVNKDPHMILESYEYEVIQGNEWYKAEHPYGQFEEAWAYQPDYGPNPHARNWWQGGVAVDLVGGGIAVSDALLPPHGFEPEAWWIDACTPQLPTKIFCAMQYPTSSFYLATQPDNFALSVVNWNVPNPWQEPQTLPASDPDPIIQWAIDIKARAIAAGITGVPTVDGDGYFWMWEGDSYQLQGNLPGNFGWTKIDFLDIYLLHEPFGPGGWIEKIANWVHATYPYQYAYTSVIFIPAISVQVPMPSNL